MKKITGIALFLMLVVVVWTFGSFNSSAQDDQGVQQVNSNPIAGVTEQLVCCEQVNEDTFCLDVKPEDCPAESRQPTTACESTSFCNPGYCYDSTDGTCLDNVPQIVCNQDGGTWSEEKPAACNLGCCILNDEAALVTLVMCKSLSGEFGLETKWDEGITDSDMCIATAGGHVKGACVYEEDFVKTCKFETKDECLGRDSQGDNTDGGSSDGTGGSASSDSTGGSDSTGNGLGLVPDGLGGGSGTDSSGGDVQASPGEAVFHEGKLCSDEELGTNCAPTRDTICLEGKEEVYFVDTCGNPANIYNADLINNDDYWANVKSKSESCSPDASDGNANSQTCGNCNYLRGSFCREVDSETANPTYGNNICKSLSCIDENGRERKHGESWCVFDNPVEHDSGKNSVGSKFFRNVCINNEVKIEPCAEFRQEECIEDSVGGFSQAACRVNRWQDCTAQVEKQKCQNSDKRDCKWMDGIEYILMGVTPARDDPNQDGAGTIDGSGTLAGIGDTVKKRKENGQDIGACVPENPPGLDFWSSDAGGDGQTEAEALCAQANAACPVTYTKKLLDSDWKCSENCECLEEATHKKRAEVCMAMGDCGPNVNYVGVKGSGVGYKVKEIETDTNNGNSGGGGLFG